MTKLKEVRGITGAGRRGRAGARLGGAHELVDARREEAREAKIDQLHHVPLPLAVHEVLRTKTPGDHAPEHGRPPLRRCTPIPIPPPPRTRKVAGCTAHTRLGASGSGSGPAA